MDCNTRRMAGGAGQEGTRQEELAGRAVEEE